MKQDVSAQTRLLPVPIRLLAGLFSLTVAAHAAPRANVKPQKKTLWDRWYTVTSGPLAGAKGEASASTKRQTLGKAAYFAYYNDKVEKTPDEKLFFQNRFWKHEEGYVNEEALGGISQTTPNSEGKADEFIPVAFNFYRSFRASELRIDGTVKNQTLTVRGALDGAPLKPTTRTLPKKVIWSVFFPVWLQRKLPEMKENETVGFNTIVEDGFDSAFKPESGTARLEKADASAPPSAKKSDWRKVIVNYRGLKSIWYVDKDGLPVRIEMPEQQLLVEQVANEQEAREFFEKGN